MSALISRIRASLRPLIRQTLYAYFRCIRQDKIPIQNYRKGCCPFLSLVAFNYWQNFNKKHTFPVWKMLLQPAIRAAPDSNEYGMDRQSRGHPATLPPRHTPPFVADQSFFHAPRTIWSSLKWESEHSFFIRSLSHGL